MNWIEVLFLFSALLLVLLNGFFVAAEFSIVKVRSTQIEGQVQAGSRLARSAQVVVRHLDDYLSATQLGITIASLGLGWIGERSLSSLLAPVFHAVGLGSVAVHSVSAAVAFTAISFFHIVLGELAPKTLAIRKPLETALWTAWPLRVFHFVTWPAIRILNGAASMVLRLFGLKPVRELELAHSAKELELIVASSARQGLLNEQERKLLENALEFSERYVHEIMVPRPDMVCLYTSRTVQENLEIVRTGRHTRYPLVVGDTDQVVGMIHVKDLLTASSALFAAGEGRAVSDGADSASRRRDRFRNGPGAAMLTLKRSVTFVPEVTTIDRLLRVFQHGRVHLAIVVDEYGGIAGLVTLEDVLEELVGEIRDEFDVNEASGFQQTPGGEAVVAGRLLVADIAERLEFTADDATVDTIGGYVVQKLGRVPKIGDRVTIGSYRVSVVRMVGHRVTVLRFQPDGLPAPQTSSTRQPCAAGASGSNDSQEHRLGSASDESRLAPEPPPTT